jgi:predicted GIY-YIG superfamily endonuclease
MSKPFTVSLLPEPLMTSPEERRSYRNLGDSASEKKNFFSLLVVLKTFVPLTQVLLFPDPRPLVERLGRDFFRRLPERPGVYLMRDARDIVLYVGKAKNLRKRLCSYRVANPDRMPRRHLRLLRAVERIELQECADEAAALARESELLRKLRPKFNRAGTWRPAPRFLVWRCTANNLELAVTETPEADWRHIGQIGSGARFLHVVLARLLWFATHPEGGFAGLPSGWVHGELQNPTTIHSKAETESALNAAMENLCTNRLEPFCQWLRSLLRDGAHPFEKAAMEAELEFVSEFFRN